VVGAAERIGVRALLTLMITIEEAQRMLGPRRK
jgi:hypothetical protein